MEFSATLIIAYCLAIIIAIVAITYIVLKLSKRKTYARSSIYLVIAFILAFTMWTLVNFSANGSAPWYSNVGGAVSKAIKSFALANNETAIFADEFAKDPSIYPSQASYTWTLFCCVYVAQISMLGMASVAIIFGLFKTFLSKRVNIISFFYALFKKRGESAYNYSTNIIYTDLKFDAIKPFIENFKKDVKSQVKVVVLLSHAATQDGSELIERLKLEEYDCYTEGLDVYALNKFTKFAGHISINFYSMFYDDEKNLEFAKLAKKFVLETKRGSVLRKRKNINFYISFQNEGFNSKVDFENEADGCIKLVNEYSWTATKFVFQNPITRFIPMSPETFDTDLNAVPSINIHFIGFGNISRALAKKMYSNYQLPNDKSRIIYHIVDQNAEESDLANDFLGEYQSMSSVYRNSDNFLEQKDPVGCFVNHSLDVTNDQLLYEYVKNVVHDIALGKDLPDIAKPKHLFFVSLGNELLNSDVACKIRTYVKSTADAEGNILIKNSNYKSVIIYPYIKSNDFFRQGVDNFEFAAGGMINISKGTIISKEDCLEQFTIDDFREKIAQMCETNGRYNLKNNFESKLSYVFETKYGKVLPYVRLFLLQRLASQDRANRKKKKDLKEINNIRDKVDTLFKQMSVLDEKIKKMKSAAPDVDLLKVNDEYASLVYEYNLYKSKVGHLNQKLEYLDNKRTFADVFAYPKQYFWPHNKKKYDNEKDYVSACKVKLLSRYRKAEFMYEDCPIVVFGRGGYISDQLRGSLEYFAKLVNISYWGEPYEIIKPRMDSEWKDLNHPKRQSNFGVALSLPSKLNVLGYEIVVDKTQAIARYALADEKEKKELKKLYDIRYPGFIECYNEFTGNLDSDANVRKMLEETCSFSNDIAINVKTNKDYYFRFLSDAIKANIDENNINIESLKEAFFKTHEKTFANYLKAEKQKDGFYFVDGSMLNMLFDYYAIVYLSTISKKLICLRDMEHNRWYIDSSSNGITPKLKQLITYDFDNKSKDELRNYCMTTNKGLDSLIKLTLIEMIKTGNIFLNEDRKYEKGNIGLFTFDMNSPTHKLFTKIYNKTYRSDILGFETILSFLGHEIPKLDRDAKDALKTKSGFSRILKEYRLTTTPIFVIRKKNNN